MKNILVVVAHADDETIGMGGAIKKHVNEGDKVYAISMTNGVGARNESNSNVVIERDLAAEKASKYLKFEWVKKFNFTDNALDHYPLLEIIQCIEKVKVKVKPELVYTHSAADLNIDHRIVANAVLTAFRPQPGEICKEIRLFEVCSSTDFGHVNITGSFVPNLFIGISETWNDKFLALKSYDKEIMNYPHSRSIDGIKNLAQLRGNQVGLSMAEAFQVIRKIES